MKDERCCCCVKKNKDVSEICHCEKKEKKGKLGVRVRVDKVCRLVAWLVETQTPSQKKDKNNSPLTMNECQQKAANISREREIQSNTKKQNNKTRK